MLGDISRVQKIYCVTGRTDMRKSFNGLMAVIRDVYRMDPYANAVYLFCGRKKNTLKALYFDRDGFVILQKRLDDIRAGKRQSMNKVGNMRLSRPTDDLLQTIINAMDGKMPNSK